jgi:peptidoglycan L-alanyl-D-glutamate endopeptidase CwlK
MSSRNPKDLIPEMQVLYEKFKEEMDRAGLDFILTCTYRSQEEQDILYERGRTTAGKIVTWTRHSKHNDRKAFDIAMMSNGKIDWRDFVYAPAGAIGEAVGLQWGINLHGKRTDIDHFQYKENV